jgi:hypothetical protein
MLASQSETPSPQRKQTNARRAFTPEEDAILKREVEALGEQRWSEVCGKVPGRTARQCRERWCDYIGPPRLRGAWAPEEDAVLREKQEELGHHWKAISAFLPGRTENDVKNRWYTDLSPEAAARPRKRRRRTTRDARGGAGPPAGLEAVETSWGSFDDAVGPHSWDYEFTEY